MNSVQSHDSKATEAIGGNQPDALHIVLQTESLVAGYEPGLPIVNGIDFTLPQGGFTTIIGPNGAGKSTFVKAIAGLLPHTSGKLLLNGQSIAGLAAHRLIHQGLAFVPQTENIFTSMSIRENLELCATIIDDRLQRRRRIDSIYQLFPDLARQRTLLAGRLSGGQRQMLATARALLSEPSVLMLDEPTAGLSPKLVDEVFATLQRVRQAGVAILLVEQNVRAALQFADEALVLVEGRIRHRGPAGVLIDNPQLGEMFLSGRHHRRAGE